MDCIIHGVTKSQTGLSDFHFHFPPALAGLFLSTPPPGKSLPVRLRLNKHNRNHTDTNTHTHKGIWLSALSGEPGGLPSMGSHSWTQLKQLSSSSSSSSRQSSDPNRAHCLHPSRLPTPSPYCSQTNLCPNICHHRLVLFVFKLDVNGILLNVL